MNTLAVALAQVGGDLEDFGRPWALVGALAVAAHAEARSTLDVDVAVAVDHPGDAAALVAALRERGYAWVSDLGTAMTTLAIPAAAGRVPLRLDLLFSLAGIEDVVARGARPVRILPELELPVAQRGDLIALKALAAGEPGREHDWRDLRSLVAGAGAADLERARECIRLLAARGRADAARLEERLTRAGVP